MDKDALIVDGFVFPTYKEAQIALKEQNNVSVIRERTAVLDGAAVRELYIKLIEREMFNTVVGYSFLYELRHRLMTEFSYTEEELPNIELPKQMEYDRVREINQGVLENKMQQILLQKKRMAITIVALIFMVVAMFVIVAVNPNVGYINTENKVLNKYSAWQEELERREQAVKEKEAELNINSED